MVASQSWALLGSAVLVNVGQAFQMFPLVDPTSLATSLNISVGCLDALNTTLSCDQDLFRMVVDVDDFYWVQDNITNLCMQECQADAYEWLLDVEDSCDGEVMNVYGKLVDVDDIAGRYWDGLGLACLTNDNLDSCMIESLDWVGSDYVRPDCDADPSDPACTDPDLIDPAQIRMANLYDNATLCSDCFVQMMFTRLISPYLPDTNHSDYLISQYQDIVDVCSTSMPSLIIRAPSSYVDGPPPATPTATPASTCAGRMVSIANNGAQGCDSLAQQYNATSGDLQYATNSENCSSSAVVCLPNTCALVQIPATGNFSCDSLAQMYSTGSLNITTTQFVTWNPNILGLCSNVTNSQYVCAGPPGGFYISPPAPSGSTNASDQDRFGSGLTDGQGPANPGVTTTPGVPTTTTASGNPNAPSPVQTGIASDCNKYKMAVNGDYCQIFAQNNGITTAQLYAWNPILGANGANCGLLFQANVYYCVDTSGASTPTSTSAPSPTPSGISPYCSKYQKVVAGNSCDSFAQSNGISDAQLYAWNPSLGSNGQNCATSLQANVFYCVGITPPSPTQTGLAANCDQFQKAVSGDSCSQFASANGITAAQLYSWNPVLGTNGQNCGTALQANVYYCIGVVGGSVSSPTTTTSTTATMVPSPTQSGIISSCDRYAAAVTGDWCDKFAQDNDISTSDLYAWNTVLGVNGASCGTALQANVYYCVGIAPPSPAQSGIVSNCDKFAMAAAGDWCDKFAGANGITDAQLYAWNPVLGSSGQNCGTAFQANVYYCIGVSS